MRAREWLTVAPAYAVPGLASFILVPVLFALLGADEYGRWVLIYGLAAGIPQLSAAWLAWRYAAGAGGVAGRGAAQVLEEAEAV